MYEINIADRSRYLTAFQKDVDMVVLTDLFGQETVKERIVAQDGDFFLVRSRRRFATYKILYYALKPQGAWCKVDILIPGTLNIPSVPKNLIVHIQGMPLMPLFAVLLLKLQGWTHHRDSTQMDFRMKQFVDKTDIKELLKIIVDNYPDETVNHQRWVPSSMIPAAQKRVDEFVLVLPETKSGWLHIGFEV